MADRQANINVNYNINTPAVQSATQAVTSAQKATDNLRKSAGQVTDQAKQMGRQFLSDGTRISQNIDGQRIQMQRLRAAIELTSQSDKKRLAQLTQDYKTLKASVDQYNASLRTTNNTTQDLTKSFGQFYTGVRTFLAAGLVKEVVQTQLEMAKLAGRFEGVEKAFKRLPQSTQLLNELRRATHGAVTDLELMQQALRANNFEIDLKQLGTLLEFAATRAQQTGQEVDYLVNSIVMGIGMKSILRLDNLGLSATRLKEELGGVSVKAASVAEITRVVAKVAAESQEKLGGYFETSATRVDQLYTSWEKLKLSLSQGLENSEFISFLKEYVDTIGDVVESWKRGISLEQVVTENMQKEKAAAADLRFEREQLGKGREADIATVEKERNSYKKRVSEYDLEISKIQALIELKEQEYSINEKLYRSGDFDAGARNSAIKDEVKNLRKQIEELEAMGNVYNKTRLTLLNERLEALTQEEKETEKIIGLVEEYKDKIEAAEQRINDARGKGFKDTQKIIANEQDLIQQLQKELDILLGKYNDFAKIKVGADKTVPGVQSTKIGAELSELSVPAYTLDGLLDKLNTYFKENPPTIVVTPAEPSQWQQAWGEFLEDGMPTIIAADIISDQLNSVLFAEVDAYDQRIKAAEKYYDRQAELAGEKYSEKSEAEKARAKELNAIEEARIKEVDRLRKEQAEKEIKARRLSIIIDTAAGIARAFATAPTIPKAIIQAAIVAAYGASNLAIVNRQRANFATGVIDLKGAGTETSDSIPANLSRGESVMTAKETKSSRKILTAIRARKLNDKILEGLKLTANGVTSIFDDSGIIAAIEKQRQPDVVKIGNTVYDVRKKGDSYKQKVRNKSMRS